MKKMILLPLLVIGMIQAADTDGVNRIQTMQNLEQGLSTIQKGLMYNSGSILLKGVDEIKNNAKDINAFDIKNEKGTQFNAKEFAERESKAISQLADEMKSAYYKGDQNRALDTYRRLQNQCLACHKIVRKW
jgi:cytochrome c556